MQHAGRPRIDLCRTGIFEMLKSAVPVWRKSDSDLVNVKYMIGI